MSSCSSIGVLLLLSIVLLLIFHIDNKENFVGNSELEKADNFINNYKKSLIEAFGDILFDKINELKETLKNGGVLIDNDRSMWNDFVEFMNVVINLDSKDKRDNASNNSNNILNKNFKNQANRFISKCKKNDKKTDKDIRDEDVTTDLLKEYKRKLNKLLKRNKNCKKYTNKTIKTHFKEITNKVIPKDMKKLTKGDIYHLNNIVDEIAECPKHIFLMSPDYKKYNNVVKRPYINDISAVYERDLRDRETYERTSEESSNYPGNYHSDVSSYNYPLDNNQRYIRDNPPVCIPQDKSTKGPVYINVGRGSLDGTELDKMDTAILPKFSYQEHYGKSYYNL